ncbi:hypothetical protein AAFF_G00202020 [Aldrovandia affinis]|uniref:DOMON domain-containing protein n=1 Tax=Aldrovandia affinis TaxID=143900 RepID=A0AAD7SWW6_9TELE|nr:hypothetical protein AAFF_G00202020 [Aldrovandia affinis]
MESLFLVFILLVCPLWSSVWSDRFLPFTEHLGHDGNVTLRWGFDRPQNEITFELTIKTRGWLGLGFSPNGGMAGADIIIGGVAPNGSTYFSDRHAVGLSLPLVDKKQSCTLLSLNETDGQTTMKFQRPLQSCDDDDFHITPYPIHLIYAFGQTDEIRYHSGRRGTKEVNLLKYSPRTNPPTSDYFDMRANNFTIPHVHTHYHCWIIKTPSFGAKHHIYRIEPIIMNHGFVHHMLLYRCHPSVNDTMEGMCYTSDISSKCLTVMAAWAMGGEEIHFPEVAGLPIGGDNGTSYFRLEIHYNNPENIAGLTDDSGLRLHYTSDLRPHDANILDVGIMVDSNYVIPPKAEAFKSYGVCNTSHFHQLVQGPIPDLNVFMVLLHTHLAGRKIRVGQFRNGQHIDYLGLDENYDFNLQQTMFLGHTKSVEPGDEIVVECTYNTASRSNPTTLGLATTNEMCFAFLYYYPAIDISTCWSIPDIKSVETAMGAANHEQAIEMYGNMNSDSIEKYQNSLKDSTQYLVMVGMQNEILEAGYIPDLNATPSVDCRSMTTPPTGSSAALYDPRAVLFLWAMVILNP